MQLNRIYLNFKIVLTTITQKMYNNVKQEVGIYKNKL